MKTAQVVVAHRPGATAYVASRLACAVKNKRSTVILKSGEQAANARNILSVLALCATVGAMIEVQACGEDESLAAETVEQILGAPESAQK